MKDHQAIIKTLREQAEEIAKADINGWGNTMTWAADAIEELLSSMPAWVKCEELSDQQILDIAINGGIYDCLADQYVMDDGRDSLAVDLVRFARKLLALPAPPIVEQEG